MVEGCNGGGFTMESLAEAGVARVLLGQDLDRDGNVEAWVGRAIYDAHGAASEFGFDRVSPELCSSHLQPVTCPRGPPHMRGIGGRSQGDDEHARERIPAGDPTSSCGAADRARAEGDAGFSAAGARPPRTRSCKELRWRDTQ